jgi:hypothetical protein
VAISDQILRIQTARNTIRSKLVSLGLVASTADIDDCAAAVDSITNRGAVSATVKEGVTYTIPKGYHNGSGTVSGVAGGGNYSLQSKSITPTKAQQNVTPDSGYYGLSDVTVGAIPESYQDVTPVTAGAEDVLATKIIVDKTGKNIAGTMVNNGAVFQSISADMQSYTIPEGYHNGSGTVFVKTETKTVTPTKGAQVITPATGKVLSQVDINAIPDAYQDVTKVDAVAADVLDGKIIVGADGAEITGAMPNNGAISGRIARGKNSYTIPAGYHDGTGTVSVACTNKTVTPTKQTQTVVGNDVAIKKEDGSTIADKSLLTYVTVNPIPAEYQDITVVTASAPNVLAGKYFVSRTGVKTEGVMENNGAINKTIDGLSVTSAAIPTGYTSGGTVSLTGDIEAALAAI